MGRAIGWRSMNLQKKDSRAQWGYRKWHIYLVGSELLITAVIALSMQLYRREHNAVHVLTSSGALALGRFRGSNINHGAIPSTTNTAAIRALPTTPPPIVT